MTTEMLSDEALKEIEADIARRDDATAMESACGEYNCPCHYRLPALCQTVRALKDANKALAKDVVTATNQAHKHRDDVEKFSTLADERHDLLSTERRRNDGLREHVTTLEKGNEKLTARNVELRQRLAQVEKERSDLQSQIDHARDFDWHRSRP